MMFQKHILTLSLYTNCQNLNSTTTTTTLIKKKTKVGLDPKINSTPSPHPQQGTQYHQNLSCYSNNLDQTGRVVFLATVKTSFVFGTNLTTTQHNLNTEVKLDMKMTVHTTKPLPHTPKRHNCSLYNHHINIY